MAASVSSSSAGVARAAATIAANPYNVIGWWDLFNRVVDTIENQLPKWVHGIQVQVSGGPKSQIRRLWYLALSAAFGRYRDRVTTAISSLTLRSDWDISNKIVSVELVYSDAGWGASLNPVPGGGGGGAINTPGMSALGRLARGPEQLTVGGSWPGDLVGTSIFTVPAAQQAPAWYAYELCPIELSTTTVIPFTPLAGQRNVGWGTVNSGTLNTLIETNVYQEYPISTGSPSGTFFAASMYPWWGEGSLVATGANWPVTTPDGLNYASQVSWTGVGDTLPTLPDDGRVITTCEQNDPTTQPPRPIVDGHTRSGLLALVAQALQNPCFLPTSAPCTLTPAGSAGLYVWPPGSNTKSVPTQQANIAAASKNVIPPGTVLNVGPDGYQIEPNAIVGGTLGSPNLGEE